MSYWGDGPDQNDFASGSVGVSALLLKERLDADIAAVLKDKGHPEQSIVALLGLLRGIGEIYPKELSIHFRRKHLNAAKMSFEEWYEKVSKRIPAKYREGVLRSAEAEFQLWEERIFNT